jgi:hypothetical protein
MINSPNNSMHKEWNNSNLKQKKSNMDKLLKYPEINISEKLLMLLSKISLSYISIKHLTSFVIWLINNYQE